MDRQIPDSERRKAARKRWLKAGGIAIAAVAAVVILGKVMRPSVSLADLNVATADTGTIDITVTGTGSVSPAFEEIITSPISTRIVEVYRQAGDSVLPGTPLLRLDLQSTETEVNKLADQIAMKRHELDQQMVNSDTHLNDLAMQVKVKEMTLNRLEAELRNERYLDSIGSGTGDRVRQAELAVSTGRLELDQLRQKLANERRVAEAGVSVKNLDINIAQKNLAEMSRTLDDARVVSPRRATLTYINDQIGEKISEGQKIAVISDLAHFRVDGELSDSYADRISVGSRAVVRIGKERLDAIVSNVTPLSRNGLIAFTLRLDQDAHPRLRSGLRTDVYIKCDVVDEAVRIPNAPYYTGPGTYNLFFLSADGSELVKREVRLGDCNFEYVQVLSGVQPGERVVLSDMSRFKDATIIKTK
ncbi:MAG: HlyD family efflux transporter periplasmic adaptor subunit [Duncaniella sp.]|nr:HlyD family efflux transporter periplasmic adaptor subunit [Duncaniella sp.]MDE6418302.1 HlyD family efflux transporter periplasmic adaptor subunit [Duncaniella sp.]